jgi:hypothetical protein
MGVQVAFDYPTWIERFPEFAEDVNPELAAVYFSEAQLHHRNDGIGPVEDANAQGIYLGLMMAHLAQLFRVANGQAVSELVGRITSATQGSVTLSSDADLPAGVPQWYAQTKYGYDYWVLMAPYRTFRYIPGPRRFFGPVYGGRPLFY